MSAKKDMRFDPALLDSMQEPLSVRVEKIRGGNRMPIDLPARDSDMAPGVGWDRDSVRRLESWLVNDWSGGGLYNFVVVDSSGRKMEWQAIYDPREFPEKTPPTMQASVVQPAMSTTMRPPSNVAAPPVAQANTGPIGGVWPPPGYTYLPTVPQQPAQAAAPQTMPQQPMMSTWPWLGFPPTQIVQQPAQQPAQAQATSLRQNMFEQDFPRRRARFLDEEENEKKNLEQRARDLEDRIRQAEKEKLEAEHRAALDKAKQEQERQLEGLRQAQAQQAAALQEEIRRMREAPAVGPNPELEALKEERAKIEKERERMERDNREAREKAEREMKEAKEREETNRRFEALQNLIAKLAEQPKQTGPDPTLLALQEQQKMMQTQLEREREKYENERREREREEKARLDREAIKEDIRRREEDAKRREDLLMAQLNDLKSSANRGPDPLIMAMQEASRSQIDAMKEIMRVQQTNTDRMQTFMMSPRDILLMQKENSSGLDDLKKDIIGTYKDVFDMQRELMMQAANLNQSGDSPTMRLVEEGLKRAGDLADRYFKTKRDEVVSAAKVQEAAVTAQAHQAQAYAIQQARMADMARREEAVRQAAAVGGNGLHGAGVAATAVTPTLTVNVAAKPKKKNGKGDSYTEELKNAEAKPEVPAEASVDPGQTISLEEHRKKVAKVTRYGKTDEEWFGEAFPHVKSLREAVDEFCKSLQMEPKRVDPKTGEIIGASPEQCVEFLIRAVNYMFAQNVRVPAVTDLFMQDRFAELLDILVPDAPQGYRDDCVKILYAMAEEAQKENAPPEVADVEEEEDDEDEDE